MPAVTSPVAARFRVPPPTHATRLSRVASIASRFQGVQNRASGTSYKTTVTNPPERAFPMGAPGIEPGTSRV
jgi:hypothetical protein